MERFYDEKLSNFSTDVLIEANPFHKDPRINFLGNLTPDIFFNNFYVSSVDKSENSTEKEIIKFTSEFNNVINTTKNNKYAKVDLIHIAGYGGCGKTTFIRHLLWKKFKDYSLRSVIDFAGEQHIEDVYVFALSKLVFQNFYIKKNLNWHEFENIRFFETRRFGNILPHIFSIISEIKKVESEKEIEENDIIELLFNYKKVNFSKNKANNDYISFLLRFYFLIQLIDNVFLGNKPIVILLDNVDSIDNIEEQKNFVFELRDFITDCNYFFGINRYNQNKIMGQSISKIVENYKMICFLTTRIVTMKKFAELSPDMEDMFGWKSFTFPQNYFNYSAIIERKINYYLDDNEFITLEKADELYRLKKFTQCVYSMNSIKRLFNGNIRYITRALSNINKCGFYNDTIKECALLLSNRLPYGDNIDGAYGMLFCMILNYFKENEVYSKKLHLSSCLPDNNISLSRLILTIIRERNKSCSIIEIFDCLSPFFDLDSICNTIYDLSEEKRDIWRRLILFCTNFPEKGIDDLYHQKDLYLLNDRATEKYSTIEICTSGEVYIETIVPHFEFMLSRHSEYDYSKNYNYHPLFSKTSEDIISSFKDAKTKYRFERKIDWVYTDVKDCCKNSHYFAEKIQYKSNWDELQYLNYSIYNFRSKHNDGSFGYKQDYGSRLIFSHIGYIERYRRFILHKYSTNSKLTEAIDINKRLVLRIKKYLNLYTSPESIEYSCCHSKRQDEAANALLTCIKKIEKSNFKDLTSIIEIIK